MQTKHKKNIFSLFPDFTYQVFGVRGQRSDVRCSPRRGFTLLETLVAISILLIAVTGPITVIGDSLNKIYFARDQMIAINLAQEGLETVRQVRDTNTLVDPANGWLTNLANGDYKVDSWNSAANSVLTPCSGINCDSSVYLDTAGISAGHYRQGVVVGVGTVKTQFSRIVNIRDVVANTETKVTSTVTWKTGGTPGSVTVSESVFNWTK